MCNNSNATTVVMGEALDSNSSNCPSRSKHPRHDTGASVSTFKGVVEQLNGRWGAQIYADHHRVWLGTFKTEKEAAMAYDAATIKLRSGDSHRNFPWTSITSQEPNFQSQFSTESILEMIKDGTYPSKFSDYLRVQIEMGKLELGFDFVPLYSNGGYQCKQLFQKELTPSDVGKLNRLVIPKKNALKYFPRILDGAKDIEAAREVDNTLVFYDRSMRLWKFRYCYWKSSQSFVFTRGWSKFVKERKLKLKDVIIFFLCESKDRTKEVSPFGVIDVSYYDRVESNSGLVENSNKDAGALRLNLGDKMVDGESENGPEGRAQKLGCGGNIDHGEFEGGYEEGAKKHCCREDIHHAEDDKEPQEEEIFMGNESRVAQKGGIRLFGVQIS
ncbi:hypothetical protein RJ639_035376 [Escallonia herrerae]|uniref:AP2/ERF and B3 domain-containing transcription factor n=1 Tax=Escallonia herrerae TaxID=1293975 RepID=A0AA89B8L4_9ASTE|nr:hypothetical protein RJ639_035376 [Escallonia herrerae]